MAHTPENTIQFYQILPNSIYIFFYHYIQKIPFPITFKELEKGIILYKTKENCYQIIVRFFR